MKTTKGRLWTVPPLHLKATTPPILVLSTRGRTPSKLTTCKLTFHTNHQNHDHLNQTEPPHGHESQLHVCLDLHWSDRCGLTSSTACYLPLSPSRNCPHNCLGPGHLHARLEYTIGRVELVLVSPLLCHSLPTLLLEAKLTLVTISPTIVQ
jgi:hypothetical protein